MSINEIKEMFYDGALSIEEYCRLMERYDK